jgi:hypothetical protein
LRGPFNGVHTWNLSILRLWEDYRKPTRPSKSSATINSSSVGVTDIHTPSVHVNSALCNVLAERAYRLSAWRFPQRMYPRDGSVKSSFPRTAGPLMIRLLRATKKGISNKYVWNKWTRLYLGGHIGLENGLIPTKRKMVHYLVNVCTQ